MEITKSRRAAMEMSMGTIVTIVLLMTVLILGVFLIQKIFNISKGAVDLTDQQLKNQINKLFSTNEDKRVIIFPESRQIDIKKGNSDEFGFVIHNMYNYEETFSYTVSVDEIANDCKMTKSEASSMIKLGGSRSNIRVASGDIMENPLRIKLTVPESASLCDISYRIDVVDSKGGIYDQDYIFITIK